MLARRIALLYDHDNAVSAFITFLISWKDIISTVYLYISPNSLTFIACLSLDHYFGVRVRAGVYMVTRAAVYVPRMSLSITYRALI